MFKSKLTKRIIFLICLLVILFFSIFSYTKEFINNDTQVISYNMPNTNDEIVVNETKVKNNSLIGLEEVTKLREYYQNNDIIGKLVIEGTSISEPILQSNDNSYYLNHNPYGKYQAEGSIYADYRTNIGDKKVLIFGHSSPGWDVPFNELEDYYSKDFYNNHKYISIYSDKGIDTYEIFSVYVETSDFTYMNLKIDDKTYNEYLKKYQNNSLYNTGVKVNEGDNILILQTCSNHRKYSNYKKKFLLVIGKKVNREEN